MHMKSNTFLATAAFLETAALAKPVAPPSSSELLRAKLHGGSTVNVPLTELTGNHGETDLQWYAKISVGTPPQYFNVLVDTGSSSLLLAASNCTTCGSQTLFDPAKSSTFSWSPGTSSELAFGTGGGTLPVSEPLAAHCTTVTDSVSIERLTASAYAFLLCDDEDASFGSQPNIDGILGLPIQADQDQGLEWALYDAGLLASPVFGLYTPPGQLTGGQLSFGGLDDTKYDRGLAFVGLDVLSVTKRSWVMNIQTIFVGGEQLEITSNTDSRTTKVPYPQALSVLDSGTAFMTAPSYETARAIYADISPAIYEIDASIGTWGAPCSDLEKITSEVTFLFGHQGAAQLNVSLPSRSLNLGPYPGKDGICQAAINVLTQTNDDGRGVWIIGSPLLKNYYTAWNGLDLQVGFAPLKKPPVSELHHC